MGRIGALAYCSSAPVTLAFITIFQTKLLHLQTAQAIDHNQAFDTGFSVESFTNLHAFHEQIQHLCTDWVLQQQYGTCLENALSDWDIICNTVPPEWWFVDPEQTVPTDFDRDVMHQLLLRCQDDAFWKMK